MEFDSLIVEMSVGSEQVGGLNWQLIGWYAFSTFIVNGWMCVGGLNITQPLVLLLLLPTVYYARYIYFLL